MGQRNSVVLAHWDPALGAGVYAGLSEDTVRQVALARVEAELLVCAAVANFSGRLQGRDRLAVDKRLAKGYGHVLRVAARDMGGAAPWCADWRLVRAEAARSPDAIRAAAVLSWEAWKDSLRSWAVDTAAEVAGWVMAEAVRSEVGRDVLSGLDGLILGIDRAWERAVA